MRAKNIIIMNGREYDALSGLPISRTSTAHHSEKPASTHRTPAAQPTRVTLDTPSVARPVASARAVDGFAVRPPAHKTSQPKEHVITHAQQVHAVTQRSHTLHRGATKKPAPSATPVPLIQKHRPEVKPPAKEKRSPLISHFTSRQVTPLPEQTAQKAEVAPAPAPASVAKPVEAQTFTPAIQVTPAPETTQPLSSRALKEQLIKERLNEVDIKKQHTAKNGGLKRLFKARSRTRSVAVAGFAILILGGYMTYLNMPHLSMRIAAARAGMSASYPEYKPDGYRFDGPIAYGAGEVSIKFRSNTSPQGYAINQRASNWDSQAVLDNYVSTKSPSYLTYSEQGLTVYSFGNQAAWVNRGILYTIEGDAPLSSEQILRIAASL